MNKKYFLLSIVLSFFWLSIVHVWGSKHHTFKAGWKDNISNISSAYLFYLEGYNIYRMPTGSLLRPIPPDQVPDRFRMDISSTDWLQHPLVGPNKAFYIVSPEVSRPYPLGAWLWYAPYAFLTYGLNFSMGFATACCTFVFFLIAHFCFFIYYHELKNILLFDETKKITFLKVAFYFFLFILYTEFIRWSGEGQYDLVAMVPLIFSFWAFKKKNYPLVLLWFGVAFSFHFRSLFSLGLPLLSGFLMLGNFKQYLGQDKTKNLLMVLGTLVLGAISSQIFLYYWQFIANLNVYSTNPYYYSLISQRSVTDVILFYLFLAGILFWFIKKKHWPYVFVASSTLLVLLTTPLVRGWYVMFLFPIFLLIKKSDVHKKSLFYACFAFYIFAASTFMNQSPFDLSFVRDLIQLFNGDNS